MNEWLEKTRHRNVYGPGDEPPEPGKKETFFAKGGLITLITVIGVIWFFRFSDYGLAFRAWLATIFTFR